MQVGWQGIGGVEGYRWGEDQEEWNFFLMIWIFHENVQVGWKGEGEEVKDKFNVMDIFKER